MSEKLGFTFYPKDWWTSDTFFELDFIERAIFLECLFIMYNNDGYMKTGKENFEKRHRFSVTDLQWKNVTDNFILDGDKYTISSVNKRLRRAVASQQNGALGGRPKSKKTDENKEDEKPRKPSLETYKNLSSLNRNELNNNSSESTVIQTGFYTVYDLEKITFEGTEFGILACRRSNQSLPVVKQLFVEFISNQKAVNKLAWKDEADAKTHFLNWISKQKNNPSVPKLNY